MSESADPPVFGTHLRWRTSRPTPEERPGSGRLGQVSRRTTSTRTQHDTQARRTSGTITCTDADVSAGGSGAGGTDGAGRVLYLGGRIHSPTDPYATALLVDGATIAWLGSTDAAGALGLADDPHTGVVDLRGALVTPAFVDAHLHITATGLALDGLDLTDAPSLTAALDRLAAAARRTGNGHTGTGAPILGTGWDETRWPERRPPTDRELAAATGNAQVYLARVDGHTAVISPALANRTAATTLPGWLGAGLVRDDAHHTARRAAHTELTGPTRRALARRVRTHAAALGIAALHEMAGPDVSSADDLANLLTLAATEPGPDITGYWAGDLATAVELTAAHGPVGAGGDLFVDGSFGSHTAALRTPYTDDPTTSGTRHLDADDIRDHLLAAHAASLQTGYHAIGDAAVDTVLDGIDAAATRLGPDGVAILAAGRHRLEHAELLDHHQIIRAARLGLIASVQPAFDARWGGPHGLYATRLGPDRAAATNPLAALARAGVTLAFSSDAPVTPLDPWGAVRAAARHHSPGSRLSTRAAFTAATRGGWRAARADTDGAGLLTTGAPATFAIWNIPGELVVTVPDRRVAAWSTDPRAAVPGLPDLTGPTPTCLRTVLRGRTIHDRLG